MKLFDGIINLAALGLLLCTAVIGAPRAHADVVGDWNAVTQTVLTAEGHREGLPYYALVHAAMYDAVNAIDGRFAVFAVRPVTDARGASKDAAGAATAYRVLLGVFPRQAQLLDTAYATSLAGVPNGGAKTKGVALGEEVAVAWLALRTHDGREPIVPHLFGGGALTAPSVYAGSVAMPARAVLTRVIDSTLRHSERGSLETEIEPFSAESPIAFYGRNLRALAAAKGLPLETNARLFAAVYVTQSGAMIACREASSGCLATAFAESLRHFFGTPYLDVPITSATGGGATRVFHSTHDVIAEIRARSQESIDDHIVASKDVARWVAKNRFALVAHGSQAGDDSR